MSKGSITQTEKCEVTEILPRSSAPTPTPTPTLLGSTMLDSAMSEGEIGMIINTKEIGITSKRSIPEHLKPLPPFTAWGRREDEKRLGSSYVGIVLY